MARGRLCNLLSLAFRVLLKFIPSDQCLVEPCRHLRSRLFKGLPLLLRVLPNPSLVQVPAVLGYQPLQLLLLCRGQTAARSTIK